MRNGHDNVLSALFGVDEQIDVDRVLTEVRGGRPIRVVSGDEAILALPLEGLTDERLAAFRSLCAPTPIRLVITARRARAIGIDAREAMALEVAASSSADALLRLVGDASAERVAQADPAGPAANAAIDLVKLAHGLPAVLAADVSATAARKGVPEALSVNADAVTRFRQAVMDSLTIAGESRVPLPSGIASRFVVFRDLTGSNSVAVVIGSPDLSGSVPVRLHSACLTGDVFGSRRCDCGDQLKLGIQHIEAAGGGVVLYLAQEGRGLGLANKMRAYRLQDAGLDTIDANTTLGFDDDERHYGIAARMLRMLGIERVRLLTNNPAKVDGLELEGIKISGRTPVYAPVHADNRRYLTAKAARAGHKLDQLLAAFHPPIDDRVPATRTVTPALTGRVGSQA